ncbi:MAG TPA: ABC transporter ATP-binding protein, partial [Candidatus Bathyarchaeota archaeon]|nr:ABC transporter ATP-binding protein [Candidatus Bathyarchaeota archaeon]
MENVVVTKDLKKTYLLGEVKVPALRGVNMEIKRGEMVSIMGPSGSGKTTLLNLLGGLDRPTAGKIWIDGVDISTLSDSELVRLRLDKIGFIFQQYYLVPWLTALANVEIPLMLKNIPRKERRKKAMKLLELVGLGRRFHHEPSKLSGGEQQRVAIARALANDPSIILADEPTGNLDTKTGAEIVNLLKRLNREENVTVIVV